MRVCQTYFDECIKGIVLQSFFSHSKIFMNLVWIKPDLINHNTDSLKHLLACKNNQHFFQKMDQPNNLGTIKTQSSKNYLLMSKMKLIFLDLICQFFLFDRILFCGSQKSSAQRTPVKLKQHGSTCKTVLTDLRGREAHNIPLFLRHPVSAQ